LLVTSVRKEVGGYTGFRNVATRVCEPHENEIL
jgi:hypothetical protein